VRLIEIRAPAELPGARAFRTDRKVTVIMNTEEGRWHVSIAHPSRYPKWGEIREIREQLLPADVWLCIPYPPKAYWVNVHRFCFHLWEIQDHLLIEIWRRDGEAAQILGGNIPTEGEQDGE